MFINRNTSRFNGKWINIAKQKWQKYYDYCVSVSNMFIGGRHDKGFWVTCCHQGFEKKRIIKRMNETKWFDFIYLGSLGIMTEFWTISFDFNKPGLSCNLGQIMVFAFLISFQFEWDAICLFLLWQGFGDEALSYEKKCQKNIKLAG